MQLTRRWAETTAVDSAACGLVDLHAEDESTGAGRCCLSLWHGVGGKAWIDHTAGCVDPWAAVRMWLSTTIPPPVRGARPSVPGRGHRCWACGPPHLWPACVRGGQDPPHKPSSEQAMISPLKPGQSPAAPGLASLTGFPEGGS